MGSGHSWQNHLERAWSIWELQDLNLCENISLPQWKGNKDSVLSLESQAALFSQIDLDFIKSRQKTKTKQFSLFPARADSAGTSHSLLPAGEDSLHLPLIAKCKGPWN